MRNLHLVDSYVADISEISVFWSLHQNVQLCVTTFLCKDENDAQKSLTEVSIKSMAK